MKITLTIFEGSPQTAVVNVPEFLIGRAADCDLQLRNSMVSRHHCLLTVQDGQVFVRDLNSSNGTGVNHQALVGERPLHNGDSLWVATTPITVRIRNDRAAWMDKVFHAFWQAAAPESANLPEKAAVA